MKNTRKKVTSRSLKVSIYNDNKLIGSMFDSFDNIEQIKSAVKDRYPSAKSCNLTDVNDTDFYKEIKL